MEGGDAIGGWGREWGLETVRYGYIPASMLQLQHLTCAHAA